MTSIIPARVLERHRPLMDAIVNSPRVDHGIVHIAIPQCDQCQSPHRSQHEADSCCTYD